MPTHFVSNTPTIVPTTLSEMYRVYQPRLDPVLLKLNRSLPEEQRREVVQEVWTQLFESDVLGKYRLSIQQPGHEQKKFWDYLQRAACNRSYRLMEYRQRHELDERLLRTPCNDDDDVAESRKEGRRGVALVDVGSSQRMDALVTLAMVRRVIARHLRRPGQADQFYAVLAEGYTVRDALAAVVPRPGRVKTVTNVLLEALDEAVDVF